VDRAAVEEWIRAHVEPVGELETTHERPWATVLRVPLADGVAWFKACAPVQAFEPRLTAELFARWPDRVATVLAHDEAVHADEHLAHGVPDLRPAVLPARYEELLRRELPLERDEVDRLRRFAPRFAELCRELAAYDLPHTVQHDDLHGANVYADGDRLRVLDWGDSSIAHPFTSLVVTFRFLDEINKLQPADPWFARLRDAYLEPWGPGLADVFALAIRVGAFAHAFAWTRQRDHLQAGDRPAFDQWYPVVLRRAVARTLE
jgi:hypothetical protein